jgi:hypothetical protein
MSEQTPSEEREGAGAQPTEENPAVAEQPAADKAPAVEQPTEIQPVPDTTAVPEEPSSQWNPPEAPPEPPPAEPPPVEAPPAYTPPPADDVRAAPGADDGPAGVEEPASPFDAPPWTPADAGPGRPELWLAAAFAAGLALAILLRRRAG